MPGLLLDTLRGKVTERRPVWLMRQAGRYLPEYRALRAEKGGFLELATDPDFAAEVTLQPVRRFGMDGAILFSDILMVPWAMGQDLSFGAGEGPRLAPPLVDQALDTLRAVPRRLDPVYETVRLVRAALPDDVTLLGFAGAPWTVATYMVAGQGSKDHREPRLMAYRDSDSMAELLYAIAELTVEYLTRQVEAGAEAVQIFDSWAGSLAPEHKGVCVIEPTKWLVDAFRKRCPDTPVIGFPKGIGDQLGTYARATGVDAMGIDETTSVPWAHRELPDGMPVQGNLDPMVLLAGGEALERNARDIVAGFAGRPHVFNLGHGIDKETPIENVERLLEIVRGKG
ncbi:uroporphyrinogen decarboxylase [Croceibacterium aestuarii]|uniref:uroporphyrinogen decarboxylase n=1 Tax=Croceibacterium aestuarii TaxID=3064139 RepID=UPI00272E5B34|nr:uroporphyrinogen decarboxylase [Croceibacterium sp. D39]